MKIRVMNISDYEQVYQLWLSCKGMGLNNLDDSKEGIERLLNRNPETCFVAESEQTIKMCIRDRFPDVSIRFLFQRFHAAKHHIAVG